MNACLGTDVINTSLGDQPCEGSHVLRTDGEASVVAKCLGGIDIQYPFLTMAYDFLELYQKSVQAANAR